MAIQTDARGKQELTMIVGRRLRASRRSAGLSQADAAKILRHKGITQVSLAEDGKRMPPLHDLVKYAELYAVPLDFLIGRIDDPIAEAEEQCQTFMVRAVSHSIADLFEKFATAVGSHVAISLSGLRKDRADLIELIDAAEEAQTALQRLRELNPDFDDMRGGSRVEMLLKRIGTVGRRVADRTRRERVQYDMIDKALQIESLETGIEHFQLSFRWSEQVTVSA